MGNSVFWTLKHLFKKLTFCYVAAHDADMTSIFEIEIGPALSNKAPETPVVDIGVTTGI
jgi:hypothetical protein